MDEPHQEAEAGVPEYMVSYADMLTIMLAFFVLLYASTSASGSKDKGGKSGEKAAGGKEPASAKGNTGRETGSQGGDEVATEERLQKVFESLYYRFGPDWTVSNCWAGGPPALRNTPKQGEDRTGRRTLRPPRSSPQEQFTILYTPKSSDNIVSGGRIYFEGSQATLNEQQSKQLHLVADDLAGKLQKFEIRGHTDRRPLGPDSPFRDHWDLAYARCRSVQQFLLAQGIDPERIRLAVAAQNEPLEIEGDPLKIKQNSRVEVRLLNEWVKK